MRTLPSLYHNIQSISKLTSAETTTIYQRSGSENYREYTLTPADIQAASGATYNNIWWTVDVSRNGFGTSKLDIAVTGKQPLGSSKYQTQSMGSPTIMRYAIIFFLTEMQPAAGDQNGTTIFTVKYPDTYSASILKLNWIGFAELQTIGE